MLRKKPCLVQHQRRRRIQRSLCWTNYGWLSFSSTMVREKRWPKNYLWDEREALLCLYVVLCNMCSKRRAHDLLFSQRWTSNHAFLRIVSCYSHYSYQDHVVAHESVLHRALCHSVPERHKSRPQGLSGSKNGYQAFNQAIKKCLDGTYGWAASGHHPIRQKTTSELCETRKYKIVELKSMLKQGC